MSRIAAPSGDVTSAIRPGNGGIGRLCSRSKSPSAARRAFSCSKASASAPAPTGSKWCAFNWKRPCGAQRSSDPRATTSRPGSIANGMRFRSEAKITPDSVPPRSRSVK